MKNHAIFLSLTDNYAYLFNALLNSIEFFGIGTYADVVVIHDESISNDYIEYMEEVTSSMETDVYFFRIVPHESDADLGKVMTVKFYRYKMMADLGRNFDSICFIDTDIFFASDVSEYFEIAANTSLAVGVNDNVIRHYKVDPEKGGPCPAWEDTREPFLEKETWDGKFICNTPLFIDMRKYHYVFEDVFNHRRKLGMDNTWPFTGDLETMNLVMLKHGLKERMVVLASHLWTGVHYSIYRTSTIVNRKRIPSGVEPSDSRYKSKVLFMSDTCEHVRAFHGRDWTDENNEKRIKEHNIPKLLGQMEGTFEDNELRKASQRREKVFDTIQAFFLFLQFRCSVPLEEVSKYVHVKQYDYLKKKHEDLKMEIGGFG
jgi:hypothetical protein